MPLNKGFQLERAGGHLPGFVRQEFEDYLRGMFSNAWSLTTNRRRRRLGAGSPRST